MSAPVTQALFTRLFSPSAPISSLVGCIGWWDASVLSSITKDGSNNVTAVADQSGNGNTVTPYGSSPTYNATGFNSSKPCFVMPSSRHGLQNLMTFGTNELTGWWVGYFTSGSDFNGRLISYLGGATHDYDSNLSWNLSRNNGTSDAHFQENASDASAAVGYSTNVRIIFTKSSSGVLTIYINGTATTGGTNTGSLGTAGSFVIGCDAQPAQVDDMHGVTAEVGVCNRFNDSTVCTALDTYLKNKWGL